VVQHGPAGHPGLARYVLGGGVGVAEFVEALDGGIEDAFDGSQSVEEVSEVRLATDGGCEGLRVGSVDDFQSTGSEGRPEREMVLRLERVRLLLGFDPGE